MAKVFVTGGAGFIGSHIVDKLIDSGHQVTVFDNLSTGNRSFVHARAEFIEGDIRSPECAQAIVRVAPNAVVHAAAQISVRVSMDDPMLDTEQNVLGLVNVLTALKGCPGTHVVFLSSGGAVYGEQDSFPATESHKIAPESVYGLAKRVGELYLELWERAWKIPYTSLRLSNVYGPRQNPHGEAGVVAIFTRGLLRGDSMVINGTGEQTRDFVFVEDVARACAAAVNERLAKGDAFQSAHLNVGTGRESSINELAETIRGIVGGKGSFSHGEGKMGEQMRSCISPAALKSAFGFAPGVTLEEGIRRTVEWFRSNG
jgi:UDP-glucose 4-epimerase